jgi:hypothetical protein
MSLIVSRNQLSNIRMIFESFHILFEASLPN